MNTYKAKSGIFDERVWYKHSEMEKICLNALRSVDLLSSSPSPTRIDRFIEKRFNIVPKYEHLTDGVLGFTKFGENGVESIVIAKALDLDQKIQSSRRINTTMAHEAGHGLFHSHLFINKGKGLFENLQEKPKVMCRDELTNAIINGRNTYDGKWWEYQANVAIGALLLPRPLAEEVIEPFTVTEGLCLKVLDKTKYSDAVMSLSETFDVNPAVAKIRLSEIFPNENAGQQPL